MVFLYNICNNKTSTGSEHVLGNLRTSKQAWLPDRYFIQDELSKSRFILTTDSGLPFDFPSMNYDKHINIIEKWLYDISVKIERVTKLSVLGPYSSEVYQVCLNILCGQGEEAKIKLTNFIYRWQIMELEVNMILMWTPQTPNGKLKRKKELKKKPFIIMRLEIE